MFPSRHGVGPALLGCALLLSSAVTHAATAFVTLSNGDTLQVEAVERTESGWTLVHPQLGTLSLPSDAVSRVDVPATPEAATASAPAADAATAAAETEADGEDDGLLGIGLLEGWTRKLELGFSGADGKSDNRKLNIGFKGDYATDEDRWAIAALYAYDEADGEASENDFFAELTRDWLEPGSPWFAFANARYDWDDFKDWDHRVSGAGGVGYQFVDDANWSVAGRAGLGGNQTFGGDRDEFTPEAILGLNGEWRVDSAQRLVFRTTFYPSIDDVGEFRNISEVSWEFKMATEADLSLRLGFSNEYDSLAESGTEKNDFKYQGGLVWGF